jgi:hypothetical protein
VTAKERTDEFDTFEQGESDLLILQTSRLFVDALYFEYVEEHVTDHVRHSIVDLAQTLEKVSIAFAVRSAMITMILKIN